MKEGFGFAEFDDRRDADDAVKVTLKLFYAEVYMSPKNEYFCTTPKKWLCTRIWE